jgi:hypothetical protein
MSLKGFHIVFVTVSTLLFVFLALWGFVIADDRSALSTFLGVTGIAGVALMQVYGVYFIRKARKLHI